MSTMVRRAVATVLVAVALSLALAAPVLAGDYANDPRMKHYLEVLRQSGEQIQSGGEMFEVLVRHELTSRFPADKYEIIGGIEYMNRAEEPFQTLGELDAVVIDRGTQKVAFLGEMKFWKDLGKAIKKARDQIARLRKSIATGVIGRFRWKNDPSRPFTVDQFKACSTFEAIGPNGASAAGFDVEINLSIDEGYWLVEQLGGNPRDLGDEERFEQLWQRHP